MPKKGKRVYLDQNGKQVTVTEEVQEDLDDFKEDDLSDDEEGNKRRRRRRLAQVPEKPKLVNHEFLPNSMSKLRACVFCKIVMNQEKWKKLQICPNCPDSRGELDTTDCFESLISLILPKKSWVAEWQKMQNLIPGLYAMAINISRVDSDGEFNDDEDDGFIVK